MLSGLWHTKVRIRHDLFCCILGDENPRFLQTAALQTAASAGQKICNRYPLPAAPTSTAGSAGNLQQSAKPNCGRQISRKNHLNLRRLHSAQQPPEAPSPWSPAAAGFTGNPRNSTLVIRCSRRSRFRDRRRPGTASAMAGKPAVTSLPGPQNREPEQGFCIKYYLLHER